MPKITEIIADMLTQAGLTHVFGLPGGVAPFLFEEFYKRPMEFTTVVARHEGAAAVMADMYGRMTGKPGILVGQGIWMGTKHDRLAKECVEKSREQNFPCLH